MALTTTLLANLDLFTTFIPLNEPSFTRDVLNETSTMVVDLLNNGTDIFSDTSTDTNKTSMYYDTSNDTSNDISTDQNETSSNATAYKAPPFPKAMLGFTAACAFIIAILGTIGNFVTIVALPRCRKLRTTQLAFVINLAVVELMFCIFILPMSGAQYAYLQYHNDSLLTHSHCNFFVFSRYTFTQVQLQTILGIAVTRAIAIGLPRYYRLIDNSYVIGTYIAFIWLYAFLLKLPTALGILGNFGFNENTMECDIKKGKGSAKIRQIAMLVEAIVPVLVIFVLYIFIFVMVKKSSMRVRRASLKPPSVSTAGTSLSEVPENEDNDEGRKASMSNFKSLKKMVSESNFASRLTRRSSSISHCISTNRRDMRVARTIFIIFIMMLICSIPVIYVHVIDSQGKQQHRLLAVHILYWIQYCLNVVVYVLLNRQYRDAYIDLAVKHLPYFERHRGFIFPWETASVTMTKESGVGGRSVATNSYRCKMDSSCRDPNPGGKDQKRQTPPSEVLMSCKVGRLSAIAEVNSSSIIPSTSDDVFEDEIKNVGDFNDNQFKNKNIPETMRDSPPTPTKMFFEEGTDEEKQLWINKNGQHVSAEPSTKGEDKV